MAAARPEQAVARCGGDLCPAGEEREPAGACTWETRAAWALPAPAPRGNTHKPCIGTGTPSPARHCPAGEARRGERGGQRTSQRQDRLTQGYPAGTPAAGQMGVSRGTAPPLGLHLGPGGSEGWEDAQSPGSWSSLPPSCSSPEPALLPCLSFPSVVFHVPREGGFFRAGPG